MIFCMFGTPGCVRRPGPQKYAFYDVFGARRSKRYVFYDVFGAKRPKRDVFYDVFGARRPKR